MPRKQKNGNPFQHNDGNLSQEDWNNQLLPQAHNLALSSSQDEIEQANHTTTITSTLEHGEKYHEAGKQDVELYIRTYNTLLRSSGEISLKALVQSHYNIDSSLHPDARSPYPDMSAFI